MSHEIDQMMSSNRTMPWHGLGTVLDGYPENWEEVRQLSGLAWEPISQPVYVQVPFIDDEGNPQTKFEELPDFHALQRDDNGKVLSVMNKSFQTYPNKDLGPLIETLLDASNGELMYETAGSLDEGRKVWALVRTKEPFEIPGDPRGTTLPFLAVQNSHDGSGALRVQRTQVRLVCANTSQMTDEDANQHGIQWKFRHTGTITERVEQARQMIQGLYTSRQEYIDWSSELLNIPITADGRRAFVEQFVPKPAAEIITERVDTNIETARGEVWGILNGETCEGIGFTAYGLVQAATEYLDHVRTARKQETRFKRNVLSAEPMKKQAEAMAREAALV